MARPGARAPRLPHAIRRPEVADVVQRCVAAAPRPPAPLPCDAAAVVEPDLPVLDAIARLALRARRNGQAFRLEHASPALLDLIKWCGLWDELVREGSEPNE